MNWTVWYKDETGDVQVAYFDNETDAEGFAAKRDEALVMPIVDVEITEI